MALVNCTECDRQISDSAPSCPYCGYQAPIEQALLIVERQTQLNGGALKTDIFVDDVHYGGIRSGGRLAIPLDSGPHHILAKNAARGWLSSGTSILEAGQEHTCHLSMRLAGGIKVVVD